jgi:hypothetical protein
MGRTTTKAFERLMEDLKAGETRQEKEDGEELFGGRGRGDFVNSPRASAKAGRPTAVVLAGYWSGSVFWAE